MIIHMGIFKIMEYLQLHRVLCLVHVLTPVAAMNHLHHKSVMKPKTMEKYQKSVWYGKLIRNLAYAKRRKHFKCVQRHLTEDTELLNNESFSWLMYLLMHLKLLPENNGNNSMQSLFNTTFWKIVWPNKFIPIASKIWNIRIKVFS